MSEAMAEHWKQKYLDACKDLKASSERVHALEDINGMLAKACDEHIARKRELEKAIEQIRRYADNEEVEMICKELLGGPRQDTTSKVSSQTPGSVEQATAAHELASGEAGVRVGSPTSSPASTQSEPIVCHHCGTEPTEKSNGDLIMVATAGLFYKRPVHTESESSEFCGKHGAIKRKKYCTKCEPVCSHDPAVCCPRCCTIKQSEKESAK